MQRMCFVTVLLPKPSLLVLAKELRFQKEESSKGPNRVYTLSHYFSTNSTGESMSWLIT